MKNDYEEPPVYTRRGRTSTWIAIVLMVLVLGFIAVYSIRSWGTRDDAYHGSMRDLPPPPARIA
ncbi:MAG: hypothetical protein ICV87_11205 [Gemmatimonadetes bacterium]|nr:hypothetical protein [Gemmatimonadota bacterium]